MPQYGFVIDHRKCIGCHACTVACKSENDVPLGDFRTWVKYTEKGSFPDVRRHFTVLRCNHCDAAPCVEICPVEALHKRPDAIVDLDRDLCIGCQACMQACPYDALYLNENSGVAEKCHYCAHRTDLGLEPACVVVCPEKAIIAGDVSDQRSEIAGLIRDQETTRRKVEKGTEPRVWYVDALEESLVPGSATETSAYLWSDRRMPPPANLPDLPEELCPSSDILTTLDVAHPPVWGWHIWTYLTTKNVAAGSMMVAPFLGKLGIGAGAVAHLAPEIVGLVFLALTGFLLVHDLGRPDRFLKILTHANRKSWLVKGTWILMAFGMLTSASLALRLAGYGPAADIIRWINLPFAVLSSAYSAWLFKQCRGRDLWIAPGLLENLVARAALMGAAVAMFIGPMGNASTVVLFSVCLDVVLLLGFIEVIRRPKTADGIRAHAALKASGAVMVLLGAMIFANGVLHLAPGMVAKVGATVLAVLGVLFYERAWIRAGQSVPLS